MIQHLTSRRAFIRTTAGAGAAILSIAAAPGLIASAKSGGPGYEPGDHVMVNTDLLNLRTEPGLSTEVIATYAFGSKATIVSGEEVHADGHFWYQVETDIDGNVGWWAGAFLTAASGDVPSDTFEVADGPLNLRYDPYLGTGVVRTLDTGDTGVVIDPEFLPNDGYLWVNVRIDDEHGSEGWLASEYITFT